MTNTPMVDKHEAPSQPGQSSSGLIAARFKSGGKDEYERIFLTDGTTVTFDQSGHVVALKVPSENEVVLSYTKSGRIKGINDGLTEWMSDDGLHWTDQSGQKSDFLVWMTLAGRLAYTAGNIDSMQVMPETHFL